MADDNVKAQMEADVQRLIESGGDPLPCSFDAKTAIALANAILALGQDVKLLMRDGIDEKGKRTRYLGAKDTVSGDVTWFNYGQFCPPRPLEDCE